MVEYRTVPVKDLHHELRAGSGNRGETDLDALADGRSQTAAADADGGYQPVPVGDAVAHRNAHAAILDAQRLYMAV
ncbi:hypothetical protein AB0M87_14540 [Streptomyces sp. NPDC051320]|uniref:hypothetical protein n=1 Tax=Streptomyces sp. NPDC051320 TaxID=3154644 RepID=UPI003436BF47